MKTSISEFSSLIPWLKNMASIFQHANGGDQQKVYPLQDPNPEIESSGQELKHNGLIEQDRQWVKALVRKLSDDELDDPFELSLDASIGNELHSAGNIKQATSKRLIYLYGLIAELADEFNKLLLDCPQLETMRVTTTRFNQSKFDDSAATIDGAPDQYLRCRATTGAWSLVLRGTPGFIDMFLMPSNQLLTGHHGEITERLRASLCLDTQLPGIIWQADNLPLHEGEQAHLIKQLFQELLLRSAHQRATTNGQSTTFGQSSKDSSDAQAETLQSLLLAQKNLAQKLVSRHEELTLSIARDLHDVVIAELMLLKRTLSDNPFLEKSDIAQTLETIALNVREICHDLAPRDLSDWGLQTVVEDLLQRISKRIGAEYSFRCQNPLPKLEDAVQLHIFRIIQECLNNTAKYADATRIHVQIVCKDETLLVTVGDNGKGFSTPADRARGLFEHGMGFSSINERTEMIRCFHPVTLSINSDPGLGTTTTLTICLSPS